MAEVLHDADQAKLLDLVDYLRSLGVHHTVPLPQLIVCGDQSAGKSSLLQAISNIRFPTDIRRCTRFPIQIALRRAAKESFCVSIHPSDDCLAESKKRLQDFKPTVKTLEDLCKVVKQAADFIAQEFSNNEDDLHDQILHIDAFGPDQPNLTLVDLPGLIHSTDNPKARDQIQKIKNVVTKYMENPLSMILAVISASNDCNNQAILDMVANTVTKDSKGEVMKDKTAEDRTIAVITKPDMATNVGLQNIVDYAGNKRRHLKLGWHVVRNPTPKDYADGQPDLTYSDSAFFEDPPWTSLDSECCGIQNLKFRLSAGLSRHICDSIPSIIEEIKVNQTQCNDRLAKLGEARNTETKQRAYLNDIAKEYTTIITRGLASDYEEAAFFTQGVENRIRNQIENIRNDFVAAMQNYGSTVKIGFRRDGVCPTTILCEPNPNPLSLLKPELWDDLVAVKHISCEEYTRDVHDTILKQNHRRELPVFTDPKLIAIVFRKLCTKWPKMVEKYVNQVYNYICSVVEKVFQQYADEHTCSKLLRQCIYPRLEEIKVGLDSKISELLWPYTNLAPKSCNPRLLEYLAKITPLENIDLDPSLGIKKGSEEYLYRLVALKLVYVASALYETLQWNMMDNITDLGIESYFLRQVKMLFETGQVVVMDRETLQQLSGESPNIASRRQNQTRLRSKLSQALVECGRIENALLSKASEPILQPSFAETTPKIQVSAAAETADPKTSHYGEENNIASITEELSRASLDASPTASPPRTPSPKMTSTTPPTSNNAYRTPSPSKRNSFSTGLFQSKQQQAEEQEATPSLTPTSQASASPLLACTPTSTGRHRSGITSKQPRSRSRSEKGWKPPTVEDMDERVSNYQDNVSAFD